MRRTTARSLTLVGLVAATMVLGAATAMADGLLPGNLLEDILDETTGDDSLSDTLGSVESVLSEVNQLVDDTDDLVGVVGGPIQVPVCGNAIAVGGEATASCEGVNSSSSTGQSNSIVGVASSVQAVACGNAVAVLSSASSSCQGRNSSSGTSSSDDGESVLDVASSVQAVVCGNSIAVLGEAGSSCEGANSASSSSGSDSDGSILDFGSQIQATICGNAVAVAWAHTESACDGLHTTGSDSGGGLVGRLLSPASLTVCGNAVAVLGADSEVDCLGSQAVEDPEDPTDPSDPSNPGEPADPNDPGDPTDPGDESQTDDPADPVNVGGPPDSDSGAEVKSTVVDTLPFTGIELGARLAIGLVFLVVGSGLIGVGERFKR